MKNELVKLQTPVYKNPLFWITLIAGCFVVNHLVNRSFSESLERQFYQGDNTTAQAKCMAKVTEAEISFFGKVRILTGISETLAEEMADMPVGKMMGCAFMGTNL